jgi:hypothetical protein
VLNPALLNPQTYTFRCLKPTRAQKLILKTSLILARALSKSIELNKITDMGSLNKSPAVVSMYYMKSSLCWDIIPCNLVNWAGHVARMGEKRNAYRI